MPNTEAVEDTTIYHTVSPTSYIDRVEWLVDGQAKASYDTDITSGASTTITRDDVTGGSFNAVNDDFQIKLYLAGTGADTPAITKVEGNTSSWSAGTLIIVR